MSKLIVSLEKISTMSRVNLYNHGAVLLVTQLTQSGHCDFKCINTDGSFECECDTGLTGTGLQDRTFHGLNNNFTLSMIH